MTTPWTIKAELPPDLAKEAARLPHGAHASLRLPDLGKAVSLSVAGTGPPLVLRVVGVSTPFNLQTRATVPPVTASELSAGMDAARITAHQLADFCGVAPRQVQRWLGTGDRMDAPPAYLRTMLALLAEPGNVALAERVRALVEVRRDKGSGA